VIKTIDDLRKASEDEIEEAKTEVTVVKDLYRYLEWLNSPEGEEASVKFKLGWRKRSLGIHPSTICKEDVCLLRAYYELTGEVEARQEFVPKTQLIWDLGTAVHSLMQAHLSEMYGDQFKEEVSGSDDELQIRSHTDGVFNFSTVRFILEMKTIKEGGNYGFAKVQATPFVDNVRQTLIYQYLHDCPFGLVLYFAKNTSEIKEHVVVWDDTVWDDIVTNTIQPVLDAANGGPMVAPTVGWHCRNWCPMYHGCPHGRNSDDKSRRHVRKFRS